MSTGIGATSGSPPERAGGYVLRRFLARGGMAELFLAHRAQPQPTSKVLVVKRVLPHFGGDSQFVQMFRREAHLAAALDHPNVVQVFDDAAAATDACFFAMEYVHGPDLNILLRTLKRTSAREPVGFAHALTIAVGMCAGLHHAHTRIGKDGVRLGIVHRDVSPSNVMLGYDGSIKITDFGVAKALALTSFTQAGTRKGKLSYMSPEQAVAQRVDARADVFAIGAVLYEMTTLKRMFAGENELAIMHKLLYRERPRPSDTRCDYPVELEQIVLKSVAKDPAERFETALDLQQALQSFARSRGMSLSPTAVGRWVAQVVPPEAHPQSDPRFFTDPEPELSQDDSCPSKLIPAEGGGTVATPVHMTAAPGTAVGAEPESGHTLLVSTQPRPCVLATPLSTATVASGAGVAGYNNMAVALKIVAAAIVVASVGLVSALWYARGSSNAARPVSTNTPAAATVLAVPAPGEAAVPSRNLAEPAAVANGVLVSPEPEDEDQVELLPDPSTVRPGVRPSTRVDVKTAPKKRRSRPRRKRPAEVPVTMPKKRARTDTLLPGG